MDFKSIKNLLGVEETLNPHLFANNEVTQFSARYNPYSKKAWGRFSTPRDFSLKRYNEFLVGRYCIHRALNFDRPLSISKLGNPIWPYNFCGSLTHSGDYVSVMVSQKYQAIGRDSEKIFDPELAKNLKDLIISKRELRINTLGYENFLTLAYSAKESLFKALSPLTGIFFNFLDVEFYAQNRSFSIKLKKNLNVNFSSRRSFQGSYEFSKNYVHTAILIPRD